LAVAAESDHGDNHRSGDDLGVADPAMKLGALRKYER
jgi:hypothetical protein